jgi:undecaprenyl diphosphate synthase
MEKKFGYERGIEPGLYLVEQCATYGVEEISIYGFTKDNVRRPKNQRLAFTNACIEFAKQVLDKGAALIVIGDSTSRMFPSELLPYTQRQGSGMKVNLLVNYGWDWDLDGLKHGKLRSSAASRIDMVVRWGGCRRLSGFLPVQSVYADFFVVEEYWPDFRPEHFDAALNWYAEQDRTLGG